MCLTGCAFKKSRVALSCIVIATMLSPCLVVAQTNPSATPSLDLPMEDGHYLVKSICVEEPVAVLPGVYLGIWRDTTDLCAALDVQPEADVLDVGTGSGILAITALERGARFVVATDINPRAVDNARLNARLRGVADRLDARLVPGDQPGAFSVIGDDERFDLITCNCPAFDADVQSYDEANAFDPGHQLVISLIQGLNAHLKPGGKLLMTYWSDTGIELLRRLADENDLQLNLPEVNPRRKQPPDVSHDINRTDLYNIPKDKIKDTLTGNERTMIVEITRRPAG